MCWTFALFLFLLPTVLCMMSWLSTVMTFSIYLSFLFSSVPVVPVTIVLFPAIVCAMSWFVTFIALSAESTQCNFFTLTTSIRFNVVFWRTSSCRIVSSLLPDASASVHNPKDTLLRSKVHYIPLEQPIRSSLSNLCLAISYLF